MRAARRVAENTGIVVSGKILNTFISLATVLMLTHSLGPQGFGLYSFVFIYIGIFSILAEFGMSPVLIREMARDKTRAGEILATGMIVKAVMALVSFVLAMLVAPFFQEEQGDILLRLLFIMGLQLFVYPILTCENIFRVELKMLYPTAVDLLRNLIYLFGVMYVVRTPEMGLQQLIILAVATTFLFSAVKYWLSRKFVRLKLSYQPALARELVKSTIPLGLSQLAITCYYRVDALMLKSMQGDAAIGYYNFAVRIAEAFSYFPAAFMSSVYPFLARFWQERQDKFLEVAELSLRCLLAAALPVAILGGFFSEQIIQLLDRGFCPSAHSLVYLIWAEFFIFLNIAFYNLYNAMNRERWILCVTLLMLAGNVTLNLLWIPRYSHPGASLATLLTEAFGGVILAVAFLHQVRYRLPLGGMLRTLAAGGVVAAGVWLWSANRTVSIPGAFITMGLACVAYSVLLLVLRAVTLEELKASFLPDGDGDAV